MISVPPLLFLPNPHSWLSPWPDGTVPCPAEGPTTGEWISRSALRPGPSRQRPPSSPRCRPTGLAAPARSSELGGSSVARAPREGRSCLCIPTTMSRHFLRLRASRRGVGTRRDCGPGLGHTAETEQMSRQPTGSAPLERTGGLHVPTPLLLPAPEALTHRVKESRVPPGTVGELRSPSSGR